MDVAVEETPHDDEVVPDGARGNLVAELLVVNWDRGRLQLVCDLLLLGDELGLLLQDPEYQVLMLTDHDKVELVQKLYRQHRIPSLEHLLGLGHRPVLWFLLIAFVVQTAFLDQQPLPSVRKQPSLPCRLALYPDRMGVVPDHLRRNLSEMRDLGLEWYPFPRVFHSIQVYRILVGQGEKDVHMLDSCLSPLFITKNQVNPVVDVLGRVVAF